MAFQKPRRHNIARRNAMIRERINRLHNEKRMRFDDCIKLAASEFYMAESTIKKILQKED